MIDVITEYTGDSCMLALGGELTIEQAVEIKKVLMTALGNTARLILDLENVSEADLTCLQLLCSAHRMSIMLNKRLILSDKRSDAFRKLCKAAGFQRHTGCVLDKQESCIWKEIPPERIALQHS